MQITKIEKPNDKTVAKSKQLTMGELQYEFNYWRATKILEKMLNAGIVSRDEYIKIDKLNRQSFSPMYAQLMPL